ncbi:DUF2207 domain-containing protein [Pigmentiphaga aceris]|uniref:DUF2207 domain-containing protein n=1 Tax=Pigmentiphaga aceris TaxID=1940612 RepID=A0A5C0B1G0_9BURK|nr:DUF2207 domain-containing protein [Pigmentiphaga aceris]QEI07806.1 DUF2207 domain-containing protein [Pigmentiphaga aceris]
MMRKCLAVLLLAVSLIGVARADERILDYFSDVKVEQNGDLLVTETIRVFAEGRSIKRGILRDFPTTYQNRNGTTTRVGFDVLGVKRDGSIEQYAEKSISNGVRIQIGSADTTLNRGEHTYEIRYRTTRQIGFFENFDELYWNATGSSWTFPIDRARARITLPSPVDIIQQASYTGPQGSTANNARVTNKAPGTISFETTRPLAAEEGLTVAAGWAKGLIAPPSQAQTALLFMQDNLTTIVSVGGFVLLALYYLNAARKTRRRSTPMVVPLYEAPDGLTASAVRYISRQAYDQRTFVVGVLELISIRAMRMQSTERGVQFIRLHDRKHGFPMAQSLLGMLTKLFGKEEKFLREDVSAGSRFVDAEQALEKTLEKEYQDRLFAKNRSVANRGVLLWLLYTAVSIGAAWWHNPDNAGYVSFSLPFAIPAILAFTGLYGAMRRGNASWKVVLFTLFFVGPFLAGGLVTLLVFTRPTGIGALPALLPFILLPVVVRAYTFLRGYTEEGYRVMDQINGLKQYLTLAESPRLQALATPQEKLGVFEKCLPYAVALDVGKAWAAAFAGAFTGIAGIAAMDAMQQMYGGHDLLSGNPDRAVRDMSNDIAPRASDHDSSSSSTSSSGGSGGWSSSGGSSSSSGSSGGGSSGGGGGGGGGSGW